MTTDELAYCAGVIDSDGSIGVKRNTYAMRRIKDCAQPTFSERVCVKQVERGAVDLLKSLFGGYLGVTKATASQGRPLWTWQVTDKRAAECLRAVLPYLRIKRNQAENCLRLREVKEASKSARVARGRGHQGSASRPDHLSDEMESLYRNAHTLNQVGVRERLSAE